MTGTPLRTGVRESLGLAWRAAPTAAACSVVATVITGLAPVAVAWLLKTTLDTLAADHPSTERLTLLALAIAVAGIALAVLGEVQRYLGAELGRRVTVLTRDRLYRSTERMSGLSTLENPQFRDRLRMAEQHSQSGPSLILDACIGTVQAVITIGGFVATLFGLNPWMALVVLAAAAPGLYAEGKLSRQRAQMMSGLSPSERREMFYSGLMTELSAAQEIRLLGLGHLLRYRMLSELNRANLQRLAMDRRDLLVQGALGLLGACVAGAGLVWAVRAAAGGNLSLGAITVFVAAIGGVQGALAALISRLGTAYNALLMSDHYRAVTQLPDDLVRGDLQVPALRHGIEFRDVWFRYSEDHPWVLRGVNLFLPFGLSTALVGHNGAGKSTIVKLLCRFYDPTRGQILWDGVDLRALEVADLRRHIGAVFQDFVCYELTAAENIAFGAVDGAVELDPADRPRWMAAAGRAGIDEVLSGLPSGYDTMLSRMFFDHSDAEDPETGVLLSGGQWQRVALARAFLRDRRDLLILDEPTSGLDAEAEADIHSSLSAHRAGLTSVLISHRLGAVRAADRIAVLGDGVVTELGDHTELMRAGGTYARLFSVQAQGYAPEGA